MPTYRLTLRYDGTDFWGSQAQPERRTVQGELESALAKLGGEAPRTVFAGRTDRGVHALGQVAAARMAGWTSSPEALARSLNSLFPGDLAASDVAECEDEFNPRFAARWREYRFWIAPGVHSPFVSRYAWTPRFSLDVNAMAEASKYLEGKRDFATFASGGEGVPWSERARRTHGTVRTVMRCTCEPQLISDGPFGGTQVNGISIRIVADGFLPHMVRNIVGALIEVGRGHRESPWIAELLEARDRRRAPGAAPANGLTLWQIGF